MAVGVVRQAEGRVDRENDLLREVACASRNRPQTSFSSISFPGFSEGHNIFHFLCTTATGGSRHSERQLVILTNAKQTVDIAPWFTTVAA